MDPIAAATSLVTNRHPEARWALLTGSAVDDAEASIVPVASKSFVLANRYALLAEAGLA
ncbi:hypothetical protein [Promicromonospora soli]